jgi:circadian clock protein KaiC
LALERISTGITGLDSLIEGGIPRGFTVLVAGNPGTGKTILASHFLIDGLNKGENGLYVSFSESKDQFFTNLEKLEMNFKDFEQQKKFVFLDFTSITPQGMKDALEEILATIIETKVKRLVIDSISAISYSYQNQVVNARIILQTVLGKIMRLEGVTSLLIAEIPTGRDVIGLGIEESITDGNIWLKHGSSDASPLTLKVFKMRGSRIVKEPHVCVINSGRGMTLYPKQSLNMTYHATNERVASGISGIDQRTGGGFLNGTATCVVGAAGTGKTTFAFQFIAEGIKRGEAGIFYSLEESTDDIRRMAENFGYDVKDLERKGLKILAKNAESQSPDAFVAEIGNEIEKGQVKRLAIDGLSSFEHTTMHEGDSMYVIAKRLASLSRENGITTIFSILSAQQTDIILQDLGGLSTICQNIVLLRYVEIGGRMKRTMITLKMRSTPHDESILQFDISSIETKDNGNNDDGGTGSWWTKGPIKITGSFDGYAGILTGTAQRLSQEIKKEEQEILRGETAAKAQRGEEFRQKEEDIASHLQGEREQRISEYKAKKVKGRVGNEKRSVGKGGQDGGKKKRSKSTQQKGS